MVTECDLMTAEMDARDGDYDVAFYDTEPLLRLIAMADVPHEALRELCAVPGAQSVALTVYREVCVGRKRAGYCRPG